MGPQRMFGCDFAFPTYTFMIMCPPDTNEGGNIFAFDACKPHCCMPVHFEDEEEEKDRQVEDRSRDVRLREAVVRKLQRQAPDGSSMASIQV